MGKITKEQLLRQYKICGAAENKADAERQKLGRMVSQICGQSMTCDICAGDEIEFRQEDDDYHGLTIEDIIEKYEL